MHGLLAIARDVHHRAVLSERAVADGSAGAQAEPPVPASITCMVLAGNPAPFAAQPDAASSLVLPPRRANGWLSRTEFREPAGNCLGVELMSGFGPVEAGFSAQRADALRQIGAADRRLAASRQKAPESRHVPVAFPIDEWGVTDLLLLSAVLDAVEPACLVDRTPEPGRRVRRMHAFPGQPANDPCDVVVGLWSGDAHRFATICIHSHLRSQCNGQILAVGETLYR